MVDGRIRRAKLRSTPRNPAEAVRAGIRELLGDRTADVVSYGTTVATNTLLERRGARVVLVTNRRFEDVIEIGRQDRRDLYALAPSRVEPLVPKRRRLGIEERTTFDGRVLTPLRRRELTALRRRLLSARPEAVAICLLHSDANPTSERAVARALAKLGVPLSVSHRLSPEHREVERFSTAIVNAYVAPRVSAHLLDLARAPEVGEIRVLASSGNAISARVARAEPVRTALSGPAAGVVGAVEIAARAGVDRFVTFDMGGTSTDVALVLGEARTRPLGEVAGHSIRLPMLDIHTIGAGGGSIARLDAGGALRVGPESAGAEPGPACYGTGVAPTVTDANLVLGRLAEDRFLGGRMRLDRARAARSVAHVAHPFGGDAARAAEGVVAVVEAAMERAIHAITVARGIDPKDLALVAFGGAGPLHAAALAAALGIRHVVLPADPGLLCARGALVAPSARETAATLRWVEPGFERLARTSRMLAGRMRRALAAEPAAAAAIEIACALDVRYAGQAYEIEVPLDRRWRDRFHEEHRRLFGAASPESPCEVVTLRARAFAREAPLPRRRRSASRGRRPAPAGRSEARIDGRRRSIPLFERQALTAASRLRGPALVVELSATTWLPPGFEARADDDGNLHLEPR